MKEQILHYLSSGIKPSQVATLVGCTPAYVSQCLANDEFKERLKEALENQPVDALEEKLTVRYEALEHTIVERMHQATVDADLPALTKALHAVVIAQDMKARRKAPIPMQSGNTTNIQYVTVAFPAHMNLAAPIVTTNEAKEIISIDNKPLAPMSTDGVRNLFANLRDKNAQKVLATGG